VVEGQIIFKNLFFYVCVCLNLKREKYVAGVGDYHLTYTGRIWRCSQENT